MMPEVLTIETLIKVLITATGCGALIGAEREWTRHDAGLRTNTLVALGSAIFGLISVYAFPGEGTDPSRVAAQVVSGIGFIGAGVILQRRRRVMGLTTAATLWVAAAVGLAAGGGQYALAWISAGFVLFVQILLRSIEVKVNQLRRGGRGVVHRFVLMVRTPDKVDRTLERIILDTIARGDVRLMGAVAIELPDKRHEIRTILHTRVPERMKEIQAHLALVGFDEVQLESAGTLSAQAERDELLTMTATDGLGDPWDA